jgi:pimeloyl-ACP methyl ester carboxylesterase
VIATLPLMAAVLVGVSGDTLCLDGSMNVGPRMRRVVLSVGVDGGRPGEGVLELHTRPPRSYRMRVIQPSADSLVVVSADRTEVAPTVRLRLSSHATWVGHLYSGRDTVTVTLSTAQTKLASTRWAEGHWAGVVTHGGVPFRLGLSLERGPCGLLRGAFDSPDQGQQGLPVTAVRMGADSVVAEAGYLSLRVAIPQRGDGAERRALFSQGEMAQPVTFTKGIRITETRRPQEPLPPYPYRNREVTFQRAEPLLTFGGTLTFPKGPGRHPAVLLLSGSGAQDRDETVAGHRPFLVLADHLTRHGFAVLRVDDRGTERTPGSALQVGLEDRVGDAASALQALRMQPEVDTTRVGLIGHSEGGYVAQVLAARDTTVRFVVLLAGPAVRGRELLLAQRAALNRGRGTSPAAVALDSLMTEQLFGALDRRLPPDSLGFRVSEALQLWRTTLPDDQRRLVDSTLAARTASQDSASLTLWSSRWFQSLYHHDPREVLSALRIPALAIYGSLDLQVPPGINIAAIASLGRESRSRITVELLPGVNHMLQRARTGLPSEYVTIEETIAPAALDAIREWLVRTTRP